MSYFEYEARMHAFRLSRIDEEYDMHLQAWLNNQATATETKGSGKSQKTVSIYKNFKEFFDYDKKIKEEIGINETNIKPQYKHMAKVAAEVNARGG